MAKIVIHLSALKRHSLRVSFFQYALENAPAKNSPLDPEYIPYETKNHVPYVIVETSEDDVLLY